jgi:hypothetical protein
MTLFSAEEKRRFLEGDWGMKESKEREKTLIILAGMKLLHSMCVCG